MTPTAPTLTDDDILVRVAAGDADAMNICLQRYGPLVWCIARKYAKNRADAEDLVQETFSDVWKSAPRFNADTASAATFVSMLARRRAIDHARRHSRQPEFETLPDPDSLPTEEPRAASRIDAEILRGLLGKLPDETRGLIELHFDESLSHQEIAERTQQPLGTVKTKLRRGLIALRNLLRAADQPEPHHPARP